MQYCLKEGLERLSLHDSSLESYFRHGATIEMEFDWAKFADLIENNISEPIIMGRTTIVLTGVRDEKLDIYEDDQGVMQPQSTFAAINDLELVYSNELNETSNTLKITGMLNAAAGSQWIEWQLAFTTCTVSWHAFITSTEWHSGLLSPN